MVIFSRQDNIELKTFHPNYLPCVHFLNFINSVGTYAPNTYAKGSVIQLRNKKARNNNVKKIHGKFHEDVVLRIHNAITMAEFLWAKKSLAPYMELEYNMKNSTTSFDKS